MTRAKSFAKGSDRHRRAPALSHLRDLTPDPANRRQHNPRNVGMLVDALQKVGASRSIVIDETGTILAGNGVVEAASEAGLTKLQVVDADGETIVAVRRTGLSASQKRALAIYDNRTAELAEWNVDQLAADLKNGEDLSAFFYDEELAKLLPSVVAPGLTDPDDVPAERPTGIVAGDLFELGRHRLLCGDCTVSSDVARLMGNSRASLCFTSPPYFDVRSYGGTDLTVEHLAAFIPASVMHVGLFAVNLGIIRRDSAVVTYWDKYIAAAHAAGLKLLSWNVWHQGVGGSIGKATAMFPIEHEFVFVFGANLSRIHRTVPNASAGLAHDHHSDRQADGSTKRNPKTVIIAEKRVLGTVLTQSPERARDGVAVDHPARFPVAFATAYLDACTDTNDFVFDPFVGSGTTVIACEQNGRQCRSIDISPAYIQMTIDRWEAFTGQKAQKVGEAVCG